MKLKHHVHSSVNKFKGINKNRSFLDYAIFLSAVILILLLVTVFFKSSTTNEGASPTIADTFCTPEEIEGIINFENAQGSTIGKILMKNISNRTCDVVGSNYLDLRYDIRNVRNLELTTTGTPGDSVIHLESGQVLYSQIRQPNGSQCNGGTKTINVLYAYRVSARNEVILKNPTGEATTLDVCNSSTVTKVDIWPLSTLPISQ